MQTFFPSHPQAIAAIWLANHLHGAPPDVITRTLAVAECPRSLFVLASVLAAATRPGAIVNEVA